MQRLGAARCALACSRYCAVVEQQRQRRARCHRKLIMHAICKLAALNLTAELATRAESDRLRGARAVYTPLSSYPHKASR